MPTDTPDAAAERLISCPTWPYSGSCTDANAVARAYLTIRAAGTPDAGPTIGEAYTRLAPWLRELDGPDLDNFYAVLARLRDEWQAAGTPDAGAVAELVEASLNYDAAVLRHAIKGESWVAGDDLDALYATWIGAARRMKERLLNQRPAGTPDPSPAGEVDLAAERLSDLVAYDPDMQLVLAEIPRLRAALARVEEKAASWQKKAELLEEMHAGMVDQRDEARQQLAAAEAKLAEALRAMLDAVSDLGDEARSEFHEPAVEAAGAALAEYVAQPAGPDDDEAVRVREYVRSINEGRCYACGWPLAKDGEGCLPGNCSFRPNEGTAEQAHWIERQRWVMNNLAAPAGPGEAEKETPC